MQDQFTMNITTSEIIDQVFDEFADRIISIAAAKNEMQAVLQQMRDKIMELLYKQYYNSTGKFMKQVDIDDLLCSSPPRTHVSKKTYVPNTPLKSNTKL